MPSAATPDDLGKRYRDAVLAPRALTPQDQGRGCRCRFTTGPGYEQCGRPAVAWLNRATARSEKRPNWWAYCEQHLFGRRVYNGQVWHCIAMETTEARGDAS